MEKLSITVSKSYVELRLKAAAKGGSVIKFTDLGKSRLLVALGTKNPSLLRSLDEKSKRKSNSTNLVIE